ncbi:putative 2-aminoethylphosphonate ABC transporter permease subunit [Azonexus sp. IMCC34842]|uniref:putative 2-aminoethylphosphonate ABC transporter permease subunit n=1 Tax=Azonexus sp. IMCC34842 TaxID=3420950 RepID=UPI003D134767
MRGPTVSLKKTLDERLSALLLLLAALALSLFLLAPLGAILLGSVQAEGGGYTLQRFGEFFTAPGTATAIWNSLWISALVTALTLPLAFFYAYAIQRSCTPLRGFFRLVGMSPLLGPSLVGAISFIQWFGTQGVLKSWLAGYSVYGPIGIVLSAVYATFPHALMILLVALGTADGRLYEAADALSTSRWRKFTSITLPGAKYGLVSAAMVVFSYTISDFGIPKVIGGNFQILAVEIYIQVVGQQNFNRGAVIALLLLLPVLLAFLIDWRVQRKQQASLTARAVPYVARREGRRDGALFVYCALLAIALLGVVGMTAYTSLVRFWPYNLEMSFDHYVFGLADAGVLDAYLNSLRIAGLTALCGTPFIFVTAYLLEKSRGGWPWLRSAVQVMATLPMGVPGMVLGIGFILFFNHPQNPLNGLYHTLTIIVVANVVHYYTSCHLTSLTALKNIDREFEAVSASLKVSQFVTFWRVTLPLCLPAVLEIARYLFINAMTTVSAVVFLYSPHTLPASVSILNLDEAGEIGPATAMATLVVLTSAVVSLAYSLLTNLVFKRHQAWRNVRR